MSFNKKNHMVLLATLLSIPMELLANHHTINSEVEHFEDGLAEFYGDEDFVSIATGTKQPIAKAPSTATVITAEQIKRMGVLDIDEALESVPGLHVSYSTNNNLPLYTFRGIYSSYNQQVLMLINGVPITNLFTGNRNQIWGGMTVESIARIEVIRGPGSAIYGADASAGVINIITKTGKTAQGSQLGIRAGSYSTQDFWLNHAWDTNGLSGFVSFEHHKTEGYKQFIEADAQTFLDTVFSTNATLAPSYATQERKNDEFRLNLAYQSLTFNLGYQGRKTGVGLGVTEALNKNTKQSSQRWNSDLTYHSDTLIDGWQVTAKLSYFDTSQEFDNNYILFPEGSDIGLGGPFPDGVIGNPEVFERHYRSSANLEYIELADHRLSVGVGYDVLDLYKVQESKNFGFGPDGEYLPPGSPVVDVTDTPYIFLSEGDRKNNYLFVQDIWQVAKDWELTAGVRYDNYSDFGSTINPRLALVWTSSLHLTTKFLYGSAYRAPSFAETKNINNPSALGNPDLTPESIDTYELAFNYQSSPSLSYDLSLFSYNWQDIIEYVPDEDATSKTAQNIGGQQGFGLEAEVSWQVSKNFKFSGNYAWLDAESDKNNDVAYVPKQQVYMQAFYQLNESIHLNVKSNWVLDRERAVDDIRKPIDDYNLTDLSLTWQPMDYDLSLSLIMKNIFDSDAREPTSNEGAIVNIPNDLPILGRATLLQLSYTFE